MPPRRSCHETIIDSKGETDMLAADLKTLTPDYLALGDRQAETMQGAREFAETYGFAATSTLQITVTGGNDMTTSQEHAQLIRHRDKPATG